MTWVRDKIEACSQSEMLKFSLGWLLSVQVFIKLVSWAKKSVGDVDKLHSEFQQLINCGHLPTFHCVHSNESKLNEIIS